MPRFAFHFARQAASAAMLSLALLVLSGCQSLSTNGGSTARVRIIDVSPDAPSVDLYHGKNALAYNLSYGTVTSYVPVSPGGYTFSAHLAGSGQVLATVKGSLAPGGHYTVLLNSSLVDLQQTILSDQNPPPTNAPSLRLIHQASRVEPVDVYLVPAGRRLSSVTPFATNLTYGANTGYLEVPSGRYTVVMLPAGALPAAKPVPLHTGAQISYSKGSARTLILIDPQPSESSPEVMTTVDAEAAS